MAGDAITVHDELGRTFSIPRDEWIAGVRAKIRGAWDSPGDLHDLLVALVQERVFDGLLEPAERLRAIDPDRERASVLLAIVQLKAGDPAAAESTLRAFAAEAGETSLVLVNLAKVASARGDAAGAKDLLRRGLARDPNQEHALLWWGAIHQRESGESGFLRAMEDVLREPASWRPQLWIARGLLDAGEVRRAVDLYRAALPRAGGSAGALLMISGDLGAAGEVELMVDLVLPAYDPRRHGPETGLNLLEGLTALGRADEAATLLARVRELGIPSLDDRLSAIEARIELAGGTASDPEPTAT